MVSVVIPCYRAAPWLPETLAAVAAQTRRPEEVIVVEDGSDDGTRAIVETWGKAEGLPVCYLRHNRNRGLSATRNAGLQQAAQPLVAWLDHDDLWQPTHLADMLATRERTGAELVYSGSQLFDSETGTDREIWSPSPAELADPARGLWGRNFIQPSATLIEAKALRGLGGFEVSIRYTQDIECWFRAVRAGWQLAYTGGVTCRYRKHPGAMSAREASMAEWKARVLARHRDWPVVSPAEWRRRLAAQWGLASRLYRVDQPTRAAWCAWRAACAGPPRGRALLLAGWWAGQAALRMGRGRNLPPVERC